jgi:hypothetical protein
MLAKIQIVSINLKLLGGGGSRKAYVSMIVEGFNLSIISVLPLQGESLRIALYGELLYEGARTDFSLIYHPIMNIEKAEDNNFKKRRRSGP